MPRGLASVAAVDCRTIPIHLMTRRENWQLAGRAIGAIFVGLLSILGCRPEPEGDTLTAQPVEPQRGGTMVIATKSDLAGVNPLIGQINASTQSVLDRMFLELFDERPDFADHPPTFEPEIALERTWSEDHLRLRIALRDDLVWSDGVPLTADDVVWTWRMQTSEEIQWNQAGSKEDITSIRALSDHVVEVLYSERSDSQIWDLNEGAILPKHAWSRLPASRWHENLDWFVEHLVVSGPYQLERWDRGQQVVLRRNESYADPDLPRIDRLVFKQVPEERNQVGQLLSGQLDFVLNVPLEDTQESSRTRDVVFKPYPGGQYNFICWNLLNPLFSAVHTRQALTMAIDRQAIIDAALFGRAKLSDSPILSTVWAHNRELEPWPYDPKRALALLAREGWTDTDEDGVLDLDGQPFAFELLTNVGSRPRVDATVMIQEQLRRVGIDVRVRNLEFNTLSELVYSHRFDAFLLGWSVDTSLDQGSIFHSRSIDKAGNLGSYSNPELDRLIDLSNSDVDADARARALGRIQEIIHYEQPYTFLWESERLAGISKRVQGATPNALDPLFEIETWWLLPSD